MKRVVAFFDMFDKIPDNSKYLFSKIVIVPVQDNTIIETNGGILSLPSDEKSVHIHYYEVEDIDMEALVENGFFKKSPVEKIKEFTKEYKIPNKDNDKGQVRED